MYHAPDREYGWRGSHAAALQIVRHAHDERVRQPIQRVMARPELLSADGPVAHNSTLAIIPADTHVVDTSYG